MINDSRPCLVCYAYFTLMHISHLFHGFPYTPKTIPSGFYLLFSFKFNVQILRNKFIILLYLLFNYIYIIKSGSFLLSNEILIIIQYMCFITLDLYSYLTYTYTYAYIYMYICICVNVVCCVGRVEIQIEI